MKYRSMGKKIDFKVSALGFGTMRLPIIGNDPKNIDEKEAIRILRHGIDSGINYVDTAYMYHEGQSEYIVGKALKDGYRDKACLADKMPPWSLKVREDLDKVFNIQLSKLQTDYVDFYLLHALNQTNWKKMYELDALDWLEAKKKAGQIKHIGFSFHDNPTTLKTIIDAYDGWEFCQIQYNFLDTEVQAGTKGLHYAASKGLGVIIMEPLRGGNLAKPVSPVQALWDSSPVKKPAVEWALDWLWNQPEISAVLSGMSTIEQVNENCAFAEKAQPGMLSASEIELVEKVKAAYKSLIRVNCTSCRYCTPCPEDVEIPIMFNMYNEASMFGVWEEAREHYKRFTKDKKSADFCIQCGVCETKCPQNLLIPDLLAEVKKHLGT
jgi:predicted aldo/keto reductase-like oxidoreductase